MINVVLILILALKKEVRCGCILIKKDDQHALCTICNFKVKHYGGTSNLQAHLTTHGVMDHSGILNNKRIISESENEKIAAPDDPSTKRKKFSLMVSTLIFNQ